MITDTIIILIVSGLFGFVLTWSGVYQKILDALYKLFPDSSELEDTSEFKVITMTKCCNCGIYARYGGKCCSNPKRRVLS